MNERKDQSRRRLADIQRLQAMITPERITKVFQNVIKISNNENKILAVDIITQSLLNDIHAKNFDLEGFYETVKNHKSIFTSSEYIRIIYNAEDFARDAIKIQIYKSWERKYMAECESVKEAGYQEDQLYILSYPNSPEIEPVKWLITEFGVYGNGIPEPIRGCRMKKDGKPSRRVDLISIPRNEDFKLEKCENVE